MLQVHTGKFKAKRHKASQQPNCRETDKGMVFKHVIIKTKNTHTPETCYTAGKKKVMFYACLKAHSQGSGGRGGESVGDGGNDSGQIVLQCDIRHSVGQVVASVRPDRQRKEQN